MPTSKSNSRFQTPLFTLFAGAVALVHSACGEPALEPVPEPSLEVVGGHVIVEAESSLVVDAMFGQPTGVLAGQISLSDYSYTAGSLPIGTCARPSMGVGMLAINAIGADLGQTLELRDGATTIATLNRLHNAGFYKGSTEVSQAYGKSFSLVAPMATLLTPNVISGLAPVSEELVVTSPAEGSTLTKGKALLLTWKPLQAESMIVFDLTGLFCHLDPMAGSFTIPASMAQQSDNARLHFLSSNRRIISVTLDGVTRTIWSYGNVRKIINYTQRSE